jgi:hypothetical protein
MHGPRTAMLFSCPDVGMWTYKTESFGCAKNARHFLAQTEQEDKLLRGVDKALFFIFYEHPRKNE